MTEHYTKISDRAAVKYAAALQLPMPDAEEVAPAAGDAPERAALRRLADTLPIEDVREILNHIRRA